MEILLFADATSPQSNVDWTARILAVVCGPLAAMIFNIIWDHYKWKRLGTPVLGVAVTANEHNRIEVRASNQGRVPVFLQKAVLYYQLGGQELHVDLTKQDDPEHDLQLAVGGQSVLFRNPLPAELRMQVRLGFQQQPAFPYIVVQSEAGHVLSRVHNDMVQPVLRQIFNLW